MRPSLCVHESPELQESRLGVKQGCNYFHYFPSPTKDLEEQLEEEDNADVPRRRSGPVTGSRAF